MCGRPAAVENLGQLLAELPSAGLYERSYMHRDQLLQALVTKCVPAAVANGLKR